MMTSISAKELRRMEAFLRAENAKQTVTLSPIPRCLWPTSFVFKQVSVFRSKEFLVQVFETEGGGRRMSVNRTRLLANARWDDGISWDELQRLKSEAGFGHLWAVEIYPAEGSVVNVANMRHLWLLPEAPPYAWVDNEGLNHER